MVLGDKIVEAGDKMRAVKRDSPTKVDNLTYTTAVADQDQGNRSFSEVAHQIYCITPPVHFLHYFEPCWEQTFTISLDNVIVRLTQLCHI